MGHAMAVAVETGLGGFVTTALTARRRTGGMHSRSAPLALGWQSARSPGSGAAILTADLIDKAPPNAIVSAFRSASVRSERGDAPL